MDLLMSNSIIWNCLIVYKEMISNNSFRNKVINKLFGNKSYINIYEYKNRILALNNPQGLVSHNYPTNQPKSL